MVYTDDKIKKLKESLGINGDWTSILCNNGDLKALLYRLEAAENYIRAECLCEVSSSIAPNDCAATKAREAWLKSAGKELK